MLPLASLAGASCLKPELCLILLGQPLRYPLLLSLTAQEYLWLKKPSFPRTPHHMTFSRNASLLSHTSHVPEDQRIWLVSILFLIAASKNHTPSLSSKSHVLLKSMSLVPFHLSLSSSLYLRIAGHISSPVNSGNTWFTSSSLLYSSPSISDLRDNPASPKHWLLGLYSADDFE